MPVSRRELIRRLRKLGFDGPVAGTNHQFMLKGSLRLAVPNPHGSHTIDDHLLRRVLRQAGVSPDEFDQAGR